MAFTLNLLQFIYVVAEMSATGHNLVSQARPTSAEVGLAYETSHNCVQVLECGNCKVYRDFSGGYVQDFMLIAGLSVVVP